MLIVYLDGRKVTGMVPNFQFSFGYMFLSVVSYVFRDWRDFTLACAVLATPFVFTYVIWPESPRWLYNKVSQRLYIPSRSLSLNVTLTVSTAIFHSEHLIALNRITSRKTLSFFYSVLNSLLRTMKIGLNREGSRLKIDLDL